MLRDSDGGRSLARVLAATLGLALLSGCSAMMIRKPTVSAATGEVSCAHRSPWPWVDLALLTALQAGAAVVLASRDLEGHTGIGVGGIVLAPAVLLPSLSYGFGRLVQCGDLVERGKHPLASLRPASDLSSGGELVASLPPSPPPEASVPEPVLDWGVVPDPERALQVGCTDAQIAEAGGKALEAAGLEVAEHSPLAVSTKLVMRRAPCLRTVRFLVSRGLSGAVVSTTIFAGYTGCGPCTLTPTEEALRLRVRALVDHFLGHCSAPAPTRPSSPAAPEGDLPRATGGAR